MRELNFQSQNIRMTWLKYQYLSRRIQNDVTQIREGNAHIYTYDQSINIIICIGAMHATYDVIYKIIIGNIY